MVFGVIAASVSDISQRELLMGIIAQAKEYGADIAVISNITNENRGEGELLPENMVYDLIEQSELDGFIMLSEPFPCKKLRDKIRDLLCRKDRPIVIAGAAMPDLVIPGARRIDTDNVRDMEELVDHLIDVHGFTDIDLLTGYAQIDVSEQRVSGCKKSLGKHGIPFDESKLIYGTFWTDSGEKLAREYISGARPLPQAVVCANDHMAFGILDEFERCGVNILGSLAVTGFDCSMMRTSHTPLLTSYRFNREQLGRDAVRILYSKVRYGTDEDFEPPKGSLIHGMSCSCSFSDADLHEELRYVRSNQMYRQWSLTCNMDQDFTGSRTLDELFTAMGKYQFLVRYVKDIVVCLYDNWYEHNAGTKSDKLICQSVMPWFDMTPFPIDTGNIAEFFQRSDIPAAYYFSPLTFDKRLFGYVVLRYNEPDVYDTFFKSWIKSVANSLEFLRLTHDISFLLECQSLSRTQDMLTGLKNDYGMKKVFDEVINDRGGHKDMHMIMLRCGLFHDVFDDISPKAKAASLLDIAAALGEFSATFNGICGRVRDTAFVCILDRKNATDAPLRDLMTAFIAQRSTYISAYGMDSFLFSIVPITENDIYTDLKQRCFDDIDARSSACSELFAINHYDRMIKIRNEFYLSPQKDFSTDHFCRKYNFSPSYLRVTYKKIFGISPLRDHINSRIYKAKYLLLTTDMKVNDVSVQCGYHDTKYFLRQFLGCTGFTPNNYRTAHRLTAERENG